MRKFISIIMLATVLCSVLTICVSSSSAYHINPSNGAKCNNTYYYVSHGDCTNVVNGSHEHTDGRICHVTAVTYIHNKYCSSCNCLLSSYVKRCTETHSICGKNSVDCAP